MLQTFLSRLGWAILLLALQVLVFNHIHIMGYATPMPYVYFLLMLSSETPRWFYITSGFGLGLVIDLFTNTPGMAAASLCACGLAAPAFLRAFSPTDRAEEEFRPSIHTMKWSGYLNYAACTTVLHCTFFFTVEAFSFDCWPATIANILGSSMLTLLLIAALELIRTRKKPY